MSEVGVAEILGEVRALREEVSDWRRGHDERLRSLESDRDRGKGVVAAIATIGGLVGGAVTWVAGQLGK